MARMLLFGQGGAVNVAGVIAIANAKSAPIKRLLTSTNPQNILDLTYGYPRCAVLILENGMLAIVNRSPDELARAISKFMCINISALISEIPAPNYHFYSRFFRRLPKKINPILKTSNNPPAQRTLSRQTGFSPVLGNWLGITKTCDAPP